MAFSTRVNIKRMLGIPDAITKHDNTIDDLLSVVDQIIMDEIGLTVSSVTTYSEAITVDFIGQTEMALTYRPVSSVVALTIGGQLQVEDTDYYVNKELGYIAMNPLYNDIPTGRNVAEITYEAGFSSVPADLNYAANLIACSLFNQQSHVGFQSERAGNYAYNLGDNRGSYIPAMAARILGKHRRVFARGVR